jgi:hypothetical protein
MRAFARALICVVPLMWANGVLAHETKCDPSLFKDSSASVLNIEETFALLDTVDQNNFESFKEAYNGNAIVPIDGVPVSFGADYKSFRQKRDELHKKYNLNYHVKQSRAATELKFSVLSNSAYQKCLETYANTQSGVHLSATDISPSGVTVIFKWKNPPGDHRSARVQVTAIGAVGDYPRTINLVSDGSSSQIFGRNPQSELRISANWQGYHDELLIPVIAQIPAKPALEICSCRLPNGITMWGPKGEFCGGQGDGAYGTYSTDCRVNVEICNCIGKGGMGDIGAWGPKGAMCLADEYHSTYSTSCRRLDATDFCSCRAGMSNITGTTLWGPLNEFCGGPRIVTWNSYGGRCAR